MKTKVPDGHDLIVNAAVRYALGRKTYIVSAVCDYIVENWEIIPDRCKEVIATDIREQKEEWLGHECDRVQWYALLEMIEKENK